MIKDFSYLIGKRFKTTKGGECKVVSAKNYREIEVVFDDGFSTVCMLWNLHKGHIKNPFHDKVYGVGVCYNEKEGKFRAKGTNRRFEDSETAFLAYKSFKEGKVRNLSEKWKEHISEDCYRALNSWSVNIND